MSHDESPRPSRALAGGSNVLSRTRTSEASTEVRHRCFTKYGFTFKVLMLLATFFVVGVIGYLLFITADV